MTSDTVLLGAECADNLTVSICSHISCGHSEGCSIVIDLEAAGYAPLLTVVSKSITVYQ